MNKTGLWIVAVVTAAWVGFMLGYSMPVHTGGKPAHAGAPAAASGGYGGSARPAASGGYGGATRPAASGGYGGATRPATGGARPAAGGYGK
jgi:hypothetical protein